MTFCNCTNQCARCGACCQAGCEHRSPAGVLPSTARRDTAVSEDRVREIVREELKAAARRNRLSVVRP